MSPEHRCWRGRATSTAASVRAALDHATSRPAGRRRADRHVVVGRRRLVRRRPVALLRPPDDQMRPYQIWRHRLGTPQADDVLVIRARRALLPRRVVDAAASSGSSSPPSRSGTSGCARAGDDPTARRHWCGRAARSSTRVDHWGDRFVVLTNLDAADFRVDDGAARRARRMDRPRRPRRAPITGSEPSPATSCSTSGATPSPSCAVLFRDGPASARLRGTSRTTSRSGQPGVGHDDAALLLPVADHTLVRVRRRRRHRRARAAQADADARRRPRPVRRRPHVGDGPRRRPECPSTSCATGHAARWHRAVRRLRLRVVRGVDAALVLRRPPVAARSRRRLGARPPAAAASSAAGGTSTASCSNKRNTFTDTLAAPTTSSPRARRSGARRDPRRQRRRPARRRLHHDATRAVPRPSPRCRSSTS